MTESDSQARSILYIEDEPVQAHLVQKVLTEAGHRVDIAANGAAGLEVLGSHAYNLVLLDYHLPGESGLDVMLRIAEIRPGTAIIMLTGAGDESVAVEAMKRGALDYLVKDMEGGFLKLIPSVVARAFREQELMDSKRKWEAQRETLILELQEALAQVKKLGGLLPICAQCKKIRDDKGYWNQVEVYVRDHSEAEFSHSLCPDCIETLYPEIGFDEIKPS